MRDSKKLFILKHAIRNSNIEGKHFYLRLLNELIKAEDERLVDAMFNDEEIQHELATSEVDDLVSDAYMLHHLRTKYYALNTLLNKHIAE